MGEITIKNWLQSMADAGFIGLFTATNGEKIIKGELVENSDLTVSLVVKNSQNIKKA